MHVAAAVSFRLQASNPLPYISPTQPPYTHRTRVEQLCKTKAATQPVDQIASCRCPQYNQCV